MGLRGSVPAAGKRRGGLRGLSPWRETPGRAVGVCPRCRETPGRAVGSVPAAGRGRNPHGGVFVALLAQELTAF
jgi:hypothetical protein